MRIGFLGTGNVASQLALGLSKAGHGVKFGSRNPNEAKERIVKLGIGSVGSHSEASEFGEIMILAIPYSAVSESISAAWKLDGKIIIDVTNPLTSSFGWAIGFTTSGAEEIAKLLPEAQIVKAFNHVFAENMATGRLGQVALMALVAGDNAGAKQVVMSLARDIGFDAVDAGPLKSARYMEALGMQLIALGYDQKMGTGIGFSFARK